MTTVASLGIHIVDILGRPVTAIPPGQNVDIARGDPHHRGGHGRGHEHRHGQARAGRDGHGRAGQG
ncbi:MAG: hypothetical protein R2851_06385 [Caldilineaceae bacterium]